MLRMLDRARWWLLLRWPSARLVYQGMLDGYVGMTAQLPDSDAYLAGYEIGRAKFISRKPWTS